MVIKSKIMTKEEVNDKFRKENYCEQYLIGGCSEFNEAEYEVSTVTTFNVDDNMNTTQVANDYVCLEIFDNDDMDLEGEDRPSTHIMLSRKGVMELIGKLSKAANLLRDRYTY